MKLSCEIVQDLLPLYEESLCGEESRTAVEEHLKDCAECQALVKNMEKLEEPKVHVKADEEDEAAAKSFRKMCRRWKTSLAVAFCVVPMLLLIINQVLGRGICFTNVDDILAVRKFVHALEKEDFAKAAACKDFKSMYDHIQNLEISWPDVNGSGYRTVVMSDKDWIVTDAFFEEYLKWDDDSQNFWGNVIYNKVQQVMIPEDVWKEMSIDSTIYVCLDTEWGRYIVEKDSPLTGCVTAEDFCNALEFIPSEIFKEAKPELEKQAWEQYYYKKNTYDEAKKMTLEEFTAYMRQKYAAELADCAEQGFSFEGAGFKSAYHNEEWYINYGMKVTYEGETALVDIGCRVKDGKIDISSIGWPQEFSGRDMVGETLFAHFASEQ